MTQQRPDIFLWENKEWAFTGASDIYSLFDPAAFGLKPYSNCSNCWKGFLVGFALRDGELYLDWLRVNQKDDDYPVINGIEAVQDDYFHIYRNLNLRLRYTGTMVIGREFDEWFAGRSTVGPYLYKIKYDLRFEDGVLQEAGDTTGSYGSMFDFRGIYDDEGHVKPEFLKMISEPDDD